MTLLSEQQKKINRREIEKRYRERNKEKLKNKDRSRCKKEGFRERNAEYKRDLKARKLASALQTGQKPCQKCKVVKPLDQFPPISNSKDGHKHTCKACEVSRTPRKPPVRALKKEGKPLDSGWRLVIGVSDSYEVVQVFIRGGIMRFVHVGMGGSYQTGKSYYSLVGDDSGRRWTKLAKAECALKKGVV